LPWFDKLTARLAVPRHARHLRPELVEGRPHPASPWFDKLTTGLAVPCRGCSLCPEPVEGQPPTTAVAPQARLGVRSDAGSQCAHQWQSRRRSPRSRWGRSKSCWQLPIFAMHSRVTAGGCARITNGDTARSTSAAATWLMRRPPARQAKAGAGGAPRGRAYRSGSRGCARAWRD